MAIDQMFDGSALLATERAARPERGARHAGPLSGRLIGRALRLGDLAAMAGAGLGAAGAGPLLALGLPAGQQAVLVAAALVSANAALCGLGAYELRTAPGLNGSLVRRCLGACAGAGAMALCALLLSLGTRAAVVLPAVWLLLCLVLGVAGQAVVAAGLSRLRASGRFSRRLAIVGLNEYSAGFLERLNGHGELVEVVGLYRDEEDAAAPEFAGRAVAGRIEDIALHGRQGRIDAVVLAMPLTQPERIARARRALRTVVSDVYLTAGLAGLRFEASEVQDLASNAVVNICPRPLGRWQSVQKAAFDRCAAAVLLALLSPLLAVIALLIKSTSAGPVLFTQPRLGFNNAMFSIYKFRTMYDADADLLADQQTMRGDRRVTPLGRVLRKLSLDELPQLLNVLNGSMSLVGPRPHAPNTKAAGLLFHDAVDDYALRHRVKPGITGWAQVNGWRGETRTVEQIRQRVAHDLYYIENWSLAFDVRIVLLTVKREINSSTAF